MKNLTKKNYKVTTKTTTILAQSQTQHGSYRKPKIFVALAASSVMLTALIACNHQVTQVDYQKSTTLVKPTQQTHKNTPAPQTDTMRGLIINRQQHNTQPIDYRALQQPSRFNSSVVYTNDPEFKDWLASRSYQKSEVLAYQHYLQSQLGAIPPMEQLLASARDARRCGFEPYEVPPASLWQNIVPTLRLLQQLQKQGYLPYSTVIRSVYRNPALNDCAGGAGESKHMTNGAIDIWVPENEGNKWAVESTFDGLCQFWQSSGQGYSFGLGLYPTGSVHLDTQGYRKWGANHSSSSSPCRF